MHKHPWRFRDRKLRVAIHRDNGVEMVESKTFVLMSEFYQLLEELDYDYDLMDWINQHDEDGVTLIYEGDIVRVYGGQEDGGYYECDRRGVVEFRGQGYGIMDKKGIFHPFDLAFDSFDNIKYQVIGNVYTMSFEYEKEPFDWYYDIETGELLDSEQVKMRDNLYINEHGVTMKKFVKTAHKTVNSMAEDEVECDENVVPF